MGDLRIGQISRGQWTREQTNNKCVESSIQPSTENFSEQDCKQVQKNDQAQVEQINYFEECYDKNNQSMAVEKFFKDNQIQLNADSKQESLNTSNQSPNLNFSKINESNDQINRSKVTNQRQHRPSYRFKPDELNNQLESGFKKRKNQKTQQTFGGTKFNSSESINNEETLKQKSTKKLQSRTTQQVWKNNFFNILFFFNRFIHRNKQRLIYFKPQELLRNQWDAINDLDPIPVILPYNKVSIFWDFITISFIFLNSFLLPFEIAFNNGENVNPLIAQITQLVFLLNFLVQMNTAYYENGVLQKNRSKIFINFLQNHLLFDCVAYLSLWSDQIGFIKLKILFLIKYFSFYEIIEKLAESFKFSYNYNFLVDLLTLFVEITLLCHLFACAWFMIGDYQQNNEMLNNWVNVNNLVGSSISSQYVSSIYFSVVTIGTIGYGDIVAKSDIEKVFICFMAIFTSVIFGYILTNIQNVYKDYHSKRKVYIRHLAELNNYLYSRDVNPHLQQMARKYLKYIHTQNFSKRVLPNETLNVLSKFLKEEIIEEIFYRSIKNIPFLQQFSHQFLNALALKMKEVNYGPDEIIMKTGSYQVPQLYYIVQGRVEIQLDQSSKQNQKQSPFSEYKTFFEHKETQSFGQYEFFSQTHQSQINVKSLEQTTLHQILLTDFIDVLNQFQVDKEKYQELKDKLNLNENYSCVNVFCQSCKSNQHLLRDCPLFFYKPQKFKIVRLYNWQIDFERTLITRSTDRLILNSLAFQQEIEDDCIFFREENQEELGSMIQLEGDEEYQNKQKLKNQKRMSCDIQSLNLLSKDKHTSSKISISIPRLSVQQSNNSALSTIQVENKVSEIQTDELKFDFQNETQQQSMNSIKKETSKNKLENQTNQSIKSIISSHSSESDSDSSQSSSSSSSSLRDKKIKKQLKQNNASRKSINEICGPNQKSRMSLSRINTKQEFQKKATLLSARTKKNWSLLEKSKSLNDVQLLVRPSLTQQINLNDPKLATQVKQNYKRLITIGQMQHVLELMQMQNAQKAAKQMIENNEDITTETVRTFKIYLPHNNIGNIIKEHQKLKLKQKLKKKIIQTVDIDNSFNLNNKQILPKQ
ncbi:cation channel family protein (macronuclear) [Tetrahymena thermophila SB210]|uniref:Cation channel family protein n=1 Tax=Tetrahymena thermophila (strain SB210) TaxID=312017 RepID=W7XHJ5_TETTS|nr:cation channel family protein [Tetrahymena thermophila SB210]EWS73856.1 cation channel family protein [Tetrahymena thermophila SB210]|eukprot:XP_012653603.1 cation channel family protein [Tetrahymena thermophila SB210]